MDVRRLSMVLGLAIGLLLAGAATALACNEPKLALDKDEAVAGETVPFSIVGVDEGAGYTVTVAGVRRAGGTASGDGSVRGSFAMPDLGSSPKTVSVEAVVQHSEGPEPGTWRSPATIRYVVPPPVARDAAPSSEPAGAPAPTHTANGSAPASQSAPASRPSGTPPPAGTQQPAAGSRPVTRRGSITTTAGARTSTAAKARTRRADAPARTRPDRAGRATTRSRATGGETSRATEPSSARTPATVSVAGRPLRREAAGSGGERARPPLRTATRAPTADRSEPQWILIVAGVALLGVALVLVAHRRRGGADHDSDVPLRRMATAATSTEATLQVEAALQEMIAEHRAQELLETKADDVTLTGTD